MVLLMAIGTALVLGKLLSLMFGVIALVEFLAPMRGESASGWAVSRSVQVAGVLILLIGAVIVVIALTNSHPGRPMTWSDAGLVIGGFAVGVLGMKVWVLPDVVRKRRAGEKALRDQGADER